MKQSIKMNAFSGAWFIALGLGLSLSGAYAGGAEKWESHFEDTPICHSTLHPITKEYTGMCSLSTKTSDEPIKEIEASHKPLVVPE